MRPAELTAAALAVLALVGCGGSGGGTTAASGPAASATSTDRSSSTSTASPSSSSASASTATTPIETSTSGHRPPCPNCGAGLHPAAAAEAVLTATHPAIGCRALVTPRYLKAAYGGERGCVAAIKGGASAKAVRISATRRRGNRALVVAMPSGGPNAGERLRIWLVREPAKVPRGRTAPLWRVDAIRSNAKVGP